MNFNNYINDISTFGQYSYVFDPENSKLWRELISRSLTMFGHAAIHETVYNRLTDEDVDYMIRKNARLGQAFNSFYAANNFTAGKIDNVLSTITSTTYNVLETKIQHGINRYVSEMTADTTAGEWLGTVFGVDALKTKTDVASIITDTALWNDTIMANESLRYVICLSTATIDWFANNDSSAYISFINEVCNSTKATMDLFTAIIGTDKLTTFMATESVVTVMASKTESMIAVTYMTKPFAAMISSETAMNVVVNSDVAMTVIVDSLTNVANSENVLNTIKENLTSIESSLPSIANSETNIAEVADVKTHIADVILSLQKTTSKTDILIANITALFASETAMTAIVNNNTALVAIVNGGTQVCRLFESSSAAVNAMNTLVTSRADTNQNVAVNVPEEDTVYTVTPYDGPIWIKTIRADIRSEYCQIYLDTISNGRCSFSPRYIYNAPKNVNQFAKNLTVGALRNTNGYSSISSNITYSKLT